LVSKVYIFSYDREQITQLFSESTDVQLVLFDDETVREQFLKVDTSGTGNLSLSLSDSTEIKKIGNISLKVTTGPGDYNYIAFRHIWNTPISFGQAKYLAFYIFGYDTGRKFNITFRSVTPDDYFSYEITDNFEGWNYLVIPLEYFTAGGSPAWSVISELVFQFFEGKWAAGEPIYIDYIGTFEKIPITMMISDE
jgi:hypothetical protein